MTSMAMLGNLKREATKKHSLTRLESRGEDDSVGKPHAFSECPMLATPKEEPRDAQTNAGLQSGSSRLDSLARILGRGPAKTPSPAPKLGHSPVQMGSFDGYFTQDSNWSRVD